MRIRRATILKGYIKDLEQEKKKYAYTVREQKSYQRLIDKAKKDLEIAQRENQWTTL